VGAIQGELGLVLNDKTRGTFFGRRVSSNVFRYGQQALFSKTHSRVNFLSNRRGSMTAEPTRTDSEQRLSSILEVYDKTVSRGKKKTGGGDRRGRVKKKLALYEVSSIDLPKLDEKSKAGSKRSRARRGNWVIDRLDVNIIKPSSEKGSALKKEEVLVLGAVYCRETPIGRQKASETG